MVTMTSPSPTFGAVWKHVTLPLSDMLVVTQDMSQACRGILLLQTRDNVQHV